MEIRGWVPRYRARRKRRLPVTARELIRVVRVDHRYGAPRTQIWLKRVHNLKVNTRTIQRIFKEFKEIGMPVLTKTPKRRARQMMLFEKDEPGDSVQVDVNGKVGRSHRVDSEEFWSRHNFATRADAEAPLAAWEQRYNHERFSLALHGRTPVEKLEARRTRHHAAVQ